MTKLPEESTSLLCPVRRFKRLQARYKKLQSAHAKTILKSRSLNKLLIVEVGRRQNAEAECDRLREVEETCLNRECM